VSLSDPVWGNLVPLGPSCRDPSQRLASLLRKRSPLLMASSRPCLWSISRCPRCANRLASVPPVPGNSLMEVASRLHARTSLQKVQLPLWCHKGFELCATCAVEPRELGGLFPSGAMCAWGHGATAAGTKPTCHRRAVVTVTPAIKRARS
jgi:hypothetical protein